MEKFGSWVTLRFAAKTLIISGMIASNAGKIFKSFKKTLIPIRAYNKLVG